MTVHFIDTKLYTAIFNRHLSFVTSRQLAYCINGSRLADRPHRIFQIMSLPTRGRGSGGGGRIVAGLKRELFFAADYFLLPVTPNSAP